MLQHGDSQNGEEKACGQDCRQAEAGFTLIELIIALGLFALIAAAGVALVESVLGIEERTSGRLDRLASVQRAVHVMQVDLDQIAPGQLVGGGDRLSFRTHGVSPPGIAVPLGFALNRGMLERHSQQGARQMLLPGVRSAHWRFFQTGLGWTDRWPPDGNGAGAWPDAVALELSLAPGQGIGGRLQHVIILPEQP